MYLFIDDVSLSPLLSSYVAFVCRFFRHLERIVKKGKKITSCHLLWLPKIVNLYIWCGYFRFGLDTSEFCFYNILFPFYIIMFILQAKLRISLAEKTLLTALGQAAVYSEEQSKPPSDIQLEEVSVVWMISYISTSYGRSASRLSSYFVDYCCAVVFFVYPLRLLRWLAAIICLETSFFFLLMCRKCMMICSSVAAVRRSCST